MVTQLRAAGITPLFRNCPPRGAGVAPYNTDALAIAAVNAHNTWLAGYAVSQGLEVFDIYTPVVDPATSLYLAGNSDDGIHPNAVGALKVARAFRDKLPRIFKNAAPFDLTKKNMGTRVTNPLNIGATSGVANGWSNGSGFTTKDISSAAPAGNWQHFANTGTAWCLATQLPAIPCGTQLIFGYRMSVALGTAIVSYRFKDNTGTAVGGWVSNSIRVAATKAEEFIHIIRAASPASATSMDLYIENQRDGLGPAVDFYIAQFTITAK
jgi:hypothetical protein